MTWQGWAPNVLWKVAWRYLVNRRWQSALMVFGIALGVAVVISIDLANSSASRAFSLSTEMVTGKATQQIEGGSQGVEESLYTRLRREDLVEAAAPVISTVVSSPQLGDQPLQLLGLDPFNDVPFRGYLSLGRAGAEEDVQALQSFLVEPGAVFISRPLAERYGLQVGDRLSLIIGGHPQAARIVGLLEPADSLNRRTLDGLVLADIATAQELAGMTGWLSHIDLILPDDGGQALRTLEQWLPQGYRIIPAGARSGTIADMAAAFQLNLSALSLLALVVGLFLIYNTMTFSVVQRRELFGTLRCLGLTRRELYVMVLGEAFLVGALGGLLGIALGIGLGQVMVRLVMQTVNDLYFTTTVQPGGIAPFSLLKGALLAIVATGLTAALPAWEAASVPPRAALLRSGLESRSRQSVRKMVAGGLLAGGLGSGLFFLPSNSVVLGFIGTLLVVLAFALLSSASLTVLMRGIHPFTGRMFGLIGRMAPRNLAASLSRTAIAVAALMVAVAVIIGVSLMIDSFRGTVIVWLEQTLQGDVYISVPGFNATRSSAPIDPQIVELVRGWPGVSRVDTLRSVMVDSDAGQVNLAATENPEIGQERQFITRDVNMDRVWMAMQSGGVLVSEPLARRAGIHAAGEKIRLYTPSGWQNFPVLGIYYDYASSEGTVLMARDVYRNNWQDDALTALALRLAPEADADHIAQQLQDALRGRQQLLIRPNRELRSDVLEVFDRTFAITVALRLLATVVAFIGVLNALLLLQLEKQREVGILRALGLTAGQLWRLVMVESGLMGLAAGLFSMPTGYSLAVILIYIINRRSFGWTLRMDVTPQAFLQALLIALVAALLAGIYPAWKMSRLPAAEVMRYE